MRATYTRKLGTETFLGFYDVHADVLSGVFRKRKRLREVGEAFRRLRACYPRKKLYVVLDNLHAVHDHPRFLALCRRLRIHLVFTPTEGSWLNAIETYFGVLKRSTLDGSDDRDHISRRRRIYRYLRLRHRRLGNARHPLTRVRLVRPIKLDRH
ncbi:MAG: transposase [Chloroflexota bacterium]|nr:transposase [Chloroflexota bacterium]